MIIPFLIIIHRPRAGDGQGAVFIQFPGQVFAAGAARRYPAQGRPLRRADEHGEALRLEGDDAILRGHGQQLGLGRTGRAYGGEVKGARSVHRVRLHMQNVGGFFPGVQAAHAHAHALTEVLRLELLTIGEDGDIIGEENLLLFFFFPGPDGIELRREAVRNLDYEKFRFLGQQAGNFNTAILRNKRPLNERGFLLRGLVDHRSVCRHGDHEGREGVGAEAPGALRRGVGRLEDLHVAVDDDAVLVPVQGHQGEDRLIRPIRFRRGTGDRHVVPPGSGKEVFPIALFIDQVQDRPVRGIVADLLLHREAVEVELLGVRGLQPELLLHGLSVRGQQGLLFPFDQPLQLRRHSGFRFCLPLNGEGQAAVHGADAELPVVLGVLLGGVGVRRVHRGLAWDGGAGRYAARYRRQGDVQLLIPRGVRRDREGLQPRAFIALSRGTIKVRARREVVDAVRADGQRQPRRVVNRHARNSLVTDKAKRERIAALLREGRAARENASQQDQHQHKHHNKRSFCFHLITSSVLFLHPRIRSVFALPFSVCPCFGSESP